MVSDDNDPVDPGSEPEPDDMLLEMQLCFALAAASRAMTSCYRPLLRPLGLTHSQYLVMLVLWQQETVTVADLGDRLQLTSATLSPILVRLERARFIQRRRSVTDARVLEVCLTPLGYRLRREVRAVPAQLAQATGMAPNEIGALRDLLQVLTMRLRTAELRPDDSAE